MVTKDNLEFILESPCKAWQAVCVKDSQSAFRLRISHAGRSVHVFFRQSLAESSQLAAAWCSKLEQSA